MDNSRNPVGHQVTYRQIKANPGRYGLKWTDTMPNGQSIKDYVDKFRENNSLTDYDILENKDIDMTLGDNETLFNVRRDHAQGFKELSPKEQAITLLHQDLYNEMKYKPKSWNDVQAIKMVGKAFKFIEETITGAKANKYIGENIKKNRDLQEQFIPNVMKLLSESQAGSEDRDPTEQSPEVQEYYRRLEEQNR